MARREVNVGRLALAGSLAAAFVAYFCWSEAKAGLFHPWHAIVLGVVWIVAILNYVFPFVHAWFKWLLRGIGFDDEPIGVNAQREILMAHAPIYFFIGAYLMQAATKTGQMNPAIIVLSFLFLAFSVNLAVASMWRRAPQRYVHWSHDIASRLGMLGIAVFAIGLVTITGGLVSAGTSELVVMVFIGVGIAIMLAFIVFYIVRLARPSNG